MPFRVVTSRFLGGLAGWAACAVLAAAAAEAQGPDCGTPCLNCPRPIPSPGPYAPNPPQMPGADQPKPVNPGETAANPSENPANQNANDSNFDFAGSQGLASGAGSFSSPGGYIDDAIPQTVFKLRYDSETGINRFDRASYMFGTWREGSFHTHALVGDGGIRGTFLDPKAKGTQIISPNVTNKVLSATLEYALGERLSVFADVPIQFVHFGPNIEDGPADQTRPEQRQFPESEVRNANSDPTGVGDVQAGFKYALIAEPNCRYLTFQFRAYAPTGGSGLGLGTGHVSLEPGLLTYQRLTDRVVVQGELTDWIPVDAGQGAGNVITFGGGIGYDVIQRPNLRVTPVAEVVGWTVLGGTEAIDATIPGTVVPAVPNGVPSINVGGTFVPNDHGFLEANGDTIVNLKFGVRTYVGQANDLYVGYGHSVTGSRWYQDIFSVEYRLHF